jgi:hypothetical protein
MNKVKYTQQELREINNEDISPYSTELIGFFEKFPRRNKDVRYNNPFNFNYKNGRKKIFKSEVPDQIILADIRNNLSKLTSDNIDEIYANITKIQIPQHLEEQVASSLFETIINCIFLVDAYVDLIIKMENHNKNIVFIINNLICRQLYRPKIFSKDNDNIACETAEQKEEKWRVNNAILIAHLYLKHKYSDNFIMEKILPEYLDKISPTSTLNIKVINRVMPIIYPQLRRCVNLQPTLSKIQSIANDKVGYPARLRYLLLDVLDIMKK